MLKFFNGIKTLEELKKKYRELCMKYHPDLGGDEETMKAINGEYDAVFPRVKNVHYSAKKEEYYERETNETSDMFKDIIERLIHMEGVVSEIVGSFIWLSGNTRTYKEQIKSMGFKWHSAKEMWYLAPAGYKRYGGREYSYKEICEMYGINARYTGRDDRAEKAALTA